MVSKEGRDSCRGPCWLWSHHLGLHLAGQGPSDWGLGRPAQWATQHDAQFLEQKCAETQDTHLYLLA